MKNLLINLIIVSLFSIFTLGCDEAPQVTDPSYSISNFSYTVDSSIEIGTVMGSLVNLGPRVTDKRGIGINEPDINNAHLEVSISGDGSEFFDIAFKYNDNFLTGVYGELTLKEPLTDMEGEVLSFEVLLNYRVVIDNIAVDKTDTATITIVVFNKDQQPEEKPDLTFGSDSGRSDEDDITSIVRPVFNIPCVIGMDIKLYFNGDYKTHNVCDSNPRQLHFNEDLAEGSYAVTYTLSVAAIEGGDETPHSPPLDVVIDTTVPVITLNGDAEIELEKGSEFTDPRAVITDSGVETDNSFLVITGDLDVNTVNTYTLRYNTKDTAGNSAVEVTRTVSIVAPAVNNDSATPSSAPDLQAASDSASNDDDYTNAMSQTFDLACPKANAVEVTAILYIGDISVSNGVCTGTSFSLTAEGSAGSYDVSYTLQSAGQASETAKSPTLTVTLDSTAPVITLNGSNPLDLVKGTAYVEVATVDDGSTLVIGGDTVDKDEIATYSITYNAQDLAGNNATEVTRTVNVIAAPIEPTAESLLVWYDGDNGDELWKTNGTIDGTVLVKDIRSGVESSGVMRGFKKLGNNYYFVANDGITGGDLWKTDMTIGNSVLVKDFDAINDARNGPWNLTILNNNLYFFAIHEGNEWLWKMNAAGTDAARIENLGAPLKAGYMNVLVAKDKLIFGVNDAGQGPSSEPWVSDGLIGGTTEQLKEIRLGNDGSDFTKTSTFEFKGELYGGANDGNGSTLLWVTDGTEVNTRKLIDAGGPENPTDFTSAGADLFYFVASDGGDKSLWKSDGTKANTKMVKNVGTAGNSDDIQQLTYVNNTLYFIVDRKELWKSDGFDGGTVRIKNMVTGDNSVYPAFLLALNNKLYFFADNGAANNMPALWESNGAEPDTKIIKQSYAHDHFILAGAYPPRVANGLIYFQLLNTATGKTELWRSNGAELGTFKLKDGKQMD